VFTGSDTMLVASLAVGAAGTICGAGNIAPEWVVRIYDEYQRGDLEAARASQDALYRLVMALRGDVFPGSIKAALHLQGICEPWPAPPAQRLDEPDEARLSRQLAAFGLLTPERSRH
jgi:dihydrodipicolinate synthase/N-acetylneuraminate lyase